MRTCRTSRAGAATVGEMAPGCWLRSSRPRRWKTHRRYPLQSGWDGETVRRTRVAACTNLHRAAGMSMDGEEIWCGAMRMVRRCYPESWNWLHRKTCAESGLRRDGGGREGLMMCRRQVRRWEGGTCQGRRSVEDRMKDAGETSGGLSISVAGGMAAGIGRGVGRVGETS